MYLIWLVFLTLELSLPFILVHIPYSANNFSVLCYMNWILYICLSSFLSFITFFEFNFWFCPPLINLSLTIFIKARDTEREQQDWVMPRISTASYIRCFFFLSACCVCDCLWKRHVGSRLHCWPQGPPNSEMHPANGP